jgi:hypothetical protein
LEDKNGGRYWPVNFTPDLEVDFMTGVSGIIHFLIRKQMQDVEFIY